MNPATTAHLTGPEGDEQAIWDEVLRDRLAELDSTSVIVGIMPADIAEAHLQHRAATAGPAQLKEFHRRKAEVDKAVLTADGRR